MNMNIFKYIRVTLNTFKCADVTEGWVVRACTSRDANLLSSALLIARQCCAESPAKFCSYSSWFGGLQVRPASAFIFFFEFLSQLVPYEPVLCLKIHVNKVRSMCSLISMTLILQTMLFTLN